MLTWKKGRIKNLKAPLIKSRSPYGNIEVVSSEDQKIKPKERKNRTFKKK